MVIAGDGCGGWSDGSAPQIDNDQKASAALDAFYSVGAGCYCRVKVDRAAGVAVLCCVHGSYSLVRGVRARLYIRFGWVNTLANKIYVSGWLDVVSFDRREVVRFADKVGGALIDPNIQW